MASSTAQWTHDRKRAVIDGVDRVAFDMERKWGVNRLRLLVDDDMRERFDRQLRRWSDVIWDGEADLRVVEETAQATIRGWEALDLGATQAQAKPLAPEVWEHAMDDGRVLAVVRSTAEAHHVARDRPGMLVWTMAEVARLAFDNSLVNAVKDAFPGAEVARVTRDPTAPRPISEELELNDPVDL